ARQIYRLFRWTGDNQVPVISTLLRVRRGERGPLADVPHCVEDTEGERKLLRTVRPNRINLGLRNVTDLPRNLFDEYDQVIFEKRHADLFHHAAAERLITELPNTTFILCGAGVAGGIVAAAVGLRNRGHSVVVAADAVYEVAPDRAPPAYERMEAKGVVFAPTDKIVVPVKRKRRPAVTVPAELYETPWKR
ncbi:MAG: isochorismatase family protein, partial [Planctomycetota bacterium]